MKWIRTEDEWPALDEYVLIYTPNRPWSDSRSNGQHFVTVAVYEKAKIQFVELHADGSKGEVTENYHFHEFGPGTFDQEEVTHWARFEVPE